MDIANWISLGALSVGVAGSIFGLHKYFSTSTEKKFSNNASLLTTINEHSLKIATLNKEIIELRTTMKTIELKVDEKLQEFNRVNTEQHEKISKTLDEAREDLREIMGGISAYREVVQKLISKRKTA